jgi:asparagine synthase (glutamine-hydrolysing)
MLDHKVVELAARMPIEVKQTASQSKKVLVETFRDLIPANIQTRKKMGFGVPIDHWFRDELKPLLYDILLSDRCLSRGLLNPVAVRTLVEEHVSGTIDHAYRLWNLLCLELWQRMMIDDTPPLSAPTIIR